MDSPHFHFEGERLIAYLEANPDGGDFPCALSLVDGYEIGCGEAAAELLELVLFCGALTQGGGDDFVVEALRWDEDEAWAFFPYLTNTDDDVGPKLMAVDQTDICDLLSEATGDGTDYLVSVAALIVERLEALVPLASAVFSAGGRASDRQDHGVASEQESHAPKPAVGTIQHSPVADVKMFVCDSCGRSLPKLGDVRFGGEFLENHCPSCYHDVLCVEGLIPNTFEARRMHDCQAAIDDFEASIAD
jgi:hypothetical protein